MKKEIEDKKMSAQKKDFRSKGAQKSQKNFKSKQNYKTYISLVIPLLNEEESLEELVIQIEETMNRMSDVNGQYEIIFIDDGSTDDSLKIIKLLKRRNNRIRAISFRRNYGKAAALDVGFNEARGKFVFTMDADLQDDPAEIINMMAKLKEGFDLVSGWKKKRFDPLSKRFLSKIYNRVTSTVTGIRLHDFNCGIKGYRREVVKSIRIYGEMHRYIPALAHKEGFRVTEIPVKHKPRKYGKSKYGLSRIMKGYLDLLTVVFTTRFMKSPLHFFGSIGTLIAAIGFCTDLYLTIEWFFGRTSLSNRPLALLGVALIIVGVQLISMGLIGEMIVKNNLKHQRYNIKDRV